MRLFDVLSSSLSGRHLIESNAGTGKTHVISALYVRLLLERELEVKQILVVTFTEAATEDLKRRIRQTIVESVRAFTNGNSSDSLLLGLLRNEKDWARAKAILEMALQTFDEASVFTIHGFCHRALQDSAFESSALFDAQFAISQERVLREIIEDFWRNEFYSVSALFSEYLRNQRLSPETLYKFVSRGLCVPFLTTVPSTERPDLQLVSRAESQLMDLYDQSADRWKKTRSEIRQVLLNSDALNRNLYRPQIVCKAIDGADAYFSGGSPLTLPVHFDKFRADSVARALKKGFPPVRHVLFEKCQQLHDAINALVMSYDQSLLAMRSFFVSHVRQELRRRKREQNLRTFDDLILDLHDALQGSRGQHLAHLLRQRYPAALVDEFQDTDPAQYSILDSIYSSQDEISLFLIGDPKQAIYSFRGADVFAYLKAASEIQEQGTLDQNWRSSAELVKATNSIFSRVKDPFVFSQIKFHPSRSACAEIGGEFRCDGKPDSAPLKIWFAKRADGADRPIPKNSAESLLSRVVCSDVVQLLKKGQNGNASIGGRALNPGDLAVLVRTNREARLVQESLQRAQVPCVLHSDQSVFSSREALEIERLLGAIASPSDEGRVRAALATDILGFSGNSLAELETDEVAWQQCLAEFSDYRLIAMDEGFMHMAESMMSRSGVRSRLLRFVDGERRLTNVLHCCELLHQAAVENGLGIDGLLKWVAEARQEADGVPAEQRQVRLETDEQSVQVVTIHKSKGLQYNIVYCPFVWNSARDVGEYPIFHRDVNSGSIVQDVGSFDLKESQLLAQVEGLAEDVRLLYVALTRARYRCTIAWGAFNSAAISALAYLLHWWSRPNSFGWTVEQLRIHFSKLSDEKLELDLSKLVEHSEGTITVSALPVPSEEFYEAVLQNNTESFAVRKPRREISVGQNVSSFSSLISGQSRPIDVPDRDGFAAREADEGDWPMPGRNFLDFPRGSRAGTVLHEIFQDIDFRKLKDGLAEDLVQQKLSDFGFDVAWVPAVKDRLMRVLETPLKEITYQFVLADIPREKRLHELAFSFPLDRLTPAKLAAPFAFHRSGFAAADVLRHMEQLEFVPVRGFLRGFIDMIFEYKGRFYLVDWKSNYLGGNSDAYSPEVLRQTMVREHYVLQYYIYSVALHRYLSFRIPKYRYESHFGGVFYLFLRGIDPAWGTTSGIYYDLPDSALIEDLSRCFHNKSN